MLFPSCNAIEKFSFVWFCFVVFVLFEVQSCLSLAHKNSSLSEHHDALLPALSHSCGKSDILAFSFSFMINVGALR